jgi:hypothetical protein
VEARRLDDLALRPDSLEEHHELQREEDHRVDVQLAALDVPRTYSCTQRGSSVAST